MEKADFCYNMDFFVLSVSAPPRLPPTRLCWIPGMERALPSRFQPDRITVEDNDDNLGAVRGDLEL